MVFLGGGAVSYERGTHVDDARRARIAGDEAGFAEQVGGGGGPAAPLSGFIWQHVYFP